MGRTRDPVRIDVIVEAATWAFTTMGFDRAKIHQVADRAKVGPGTVYLYAEDKDALFELALLRALESPIVANPALPYQKTAPAALGRLIEDCLHEIAHFPQLWVAAQRREHEGSAQEYYGVLLELCRWLRRYQSVILLADRNRLGWPQVAASLERVVWGDLQRRLTGYLSARMRTGHLTPVADPAMVARFTIDALVASLVTGPLMSPAGVRPRDDESLARLVAAGVIGSGDRLPLPPHPGQDSRV